MIKFSVIAALFLLAAGIVSTGTNTSYSQNNGLPQGGNSEAEQAIEQSQDSKQGAPCVSGDDTVITCNNIAAQALSSGAEVPDPDPIPVPDELTLCHVQPGNPEKSQTITESISAVPAHLAHGDSIGACPTR